MPCSDLVFCGGPGVLAGLTAVLPSRHLKDGSTGAWRVGATEATRGPGHLPSRLLLNRVPVSQTPVAMRRLGFCSIRSSTLSPKCMPAQVMRPISTVSQLIV